MDTKGQGWLQSRTNRRLRRLGKYLLSPVSKGQRWRQRSGFPHCQNRCQDPLLTRHQQNTAEALCEFMYETERLSNYFLISDCCLPYHCPTQAKGTGSCGGEQENMDSGLQSKCPLVVRIPDWLIHSFGPRFVAFVQAAWWPDL